MSIKCRRDDLHIWSRPVPATSWNRSCTQVYCYFFLVGSFPFFILLFLLFFFSFPPFFLFEGIELWMWMKNGRKRGKVWGGRRKRRICKLRKGLEDKQVNRRLQYVHACHRVRPEGQQPTHIRRPFSHLTKTTRSLSLYCMWSSGLSHPVTLPPIYPSAIHPSIHPSPNIQHCTQTLFVTLPTPSYFNTSFCHIVSTSTTTRS